MKGAKVMFCAMIQRCGQKRHVTLGQKLDILGGEASVTIRAPIQYIPAHDSYFKIASLMKSSNKRHPSNKAPLDCG